MPTYTARVLKRCDRRMVSGNGNHQVAVGLFEIICSVLTPAQTNVGRTRGGQRSGLPNYQVGTAGFPLTWNLTPLNV